MAVVQDPDGNKIIIHKLKPNEKGVHDQGSCIRRHCR